MQMLRQSSGNQDERVGGNTPLLDLEDPLLDGGFLGHSSANDSFLTGRLPSFEGMETRLHSAGKWPLLMAMSFHTDKNNCTNHRIQPAKAGCLGKV